MKKLKKFITPAVKIHTLEVRNLMQSTGGSGGGDEGYEGQKAEVKPSSGSQFWHYNNEKKSEA